MIGFNGGLIGKARAIGKQQSMPGMWSSPEQSNAKRAQSWPINRDSTYLDSYPFEAGYSLRNLYRNYSGNVILVRRGSDNAEQAFTSSHVLDGTLVTWLNGSDGFVKTWYDQSGNARHATQATFASQPYIAVTGALIYYNSAPTVFLPSRNGLATTYDPGSTYSFFLCGAQTKTGAPRMIASSSNYLMTFNRATNSFLSGTSHVADTTVVPAASYAIGTLIKTPSSGRGYINEVDRTSTATGNNNTWPAFSIGSGSAFPGETPNAYFLDVLVYASDQTSNRLAIVNAINSYYAIF